MRGAGTVAIMRASLRLAGRMASEPLDLTSRDQRSLDSDEAIPLEPRTVVAFIGRTERGPLDEPVAIKGFDHYRRVFGGHCSFSFVSFAVEHFFLHGGETAVVVRVANRAGRALLEVPAGAGVLKLEAREPGGRARSSSTTRSCSRACR